MLSIIERGCSRVSSCFVPILLSCRQQEVNKRLSFSGIEFPHLKVHTILHIMYSFLTEHNVVNSLDVHSQSVMPFFGQNYPVMTVMTRVCLLGNGHNYELHFVLWKLIKYHFTAEPRHYYYTNRKRFHLFGIVSWLRFGSNFRAQTINFPIATLM
jgi:hypothetical protein